MLVHNSPPFPNPHEHKSLNTPIDENLSPSRACTPSAEELANKIARLASQHHISEYSCLKYGPTGYPGRYVPLSIQAPETFNELRTRQAEWSNKNKAWWYSEHTTGSAATPVVLGPSGSTGPDSATASNGLAQELSAAMDEQLPQEGTAIQSSSPTPGAQIHTIKTSASHPINISAIIPPEIIALISSHLMFTSSAEQTVLPSSVPPLDAQPVIFEAPSPFTLDRFISSHHVQTHQNNIPRPSLPVDTLSSPTFRTRSHVTEALQAAINSGIKSAPSESEIVSPTTFHSNGSSVSLSISVKSPQALTRAVSAHGPTKETSEITSFREPIDLPSEGTSETGPPTDAELRAESQLPSLPSDPSILQTMTTPSFLLGNLFMSSCPGKKVRLQGPVKGRSGVRRDLSSDLRRMRSLGVGCVVCCLDDDELSFLGAPWEEYQSATSQMGLDVLRLPTPEGLSPSLSPELLDKELTSLIQNYTLRGIPVLVHCRGGVGRAGVIACCWILKLGLCGWLDGGLSPVTSTSRSLSSSTLSSDPSTSSKQSIRQDTLDLVEKVITVVRRRRSVKAVETYEQAKFLVDFIEHLRSLQPR